MRHLTTVASAFALSICAAASCASPLDLAPILLPKAAAPGKDVQPFVKIDAPVVALTHVRVIDGTGGPARADRTIVIEDGKIRAMGTTALRFPPVPNGSTSPGTPCSRDWWACTITCTTSRGPIWACKRTTAQRPAADRAGDGFLRAAPVSRQRRHHLAHDRQRRALHRPQSQARDRRGQLPGPHIDVTGPYLEGSSSPFIQMHPERCRGREADRGVLGASRARPRSRPT